MALLSDTVLLIYCDFDGDPADHDAWHTYEHLHERLSIPGFLRGTRWMAKSGAPRYMILYEVADPDVTASSAYLARLDSPTAWTAAIMARLRGMVRGFGTMASSAGYGLGTTALSLRFMPLEGSEERVRERMSTEIIPALASSRGVASVCLIRPTARPPMTREQSLRGRDAEMEWVLLATAYDAEVLERAAERHLAPAALERIGIACPALDAIYEMRYVVTAADAARTAPNPLWKNTMETS